MKQSSSSKFSKYLWLLIVICGLSAFCLSISLIRSKQHIMQHGYTIGQLEGSCIAYDIRISELNKEILKRSNLSPSSKICSNWVKSPLVHHIKKRDVQYYAFNKRSKNNQTVAQNTRR